MHSVQHDAGIFTLQKGCKDYESLQQGLANKKKSSKIVAKKKVMMTIILRLFNFISFNVFKKTVLPGGVSLQ